MKVTLQVGEVGVKLNGILMSERDVRRMLKLLALIDATRAADESPEPERQPMGFSAPVLERLPDELAAEPG